MQNSGNNPNAIKTVDRNRRARGGRLAAGERTGRLSREAFPEHTGTNSGGQTRAYRVRERRQWEKKGKRNQKKKVNKTNTAVKAKKERARRERDTSLKHSMTQISGTM